MRNVLNNLKPQILQRDGLQAGLAEMTGKVKGDSDEKWRVLYNGEKNMKNIAGKMTGEIEDERNN